MVPYLDSAFEPMKQMSVSSQIKILHSLLGGAGDELKWLFSIDFVSEFVPDSLDCSLSTGLELPARISRANFSSFQNAAQMDSFFKS